VVAGLAIGLAGCSSASAVGTTKPTGSTSSTSSQTTSTTPTTVSGPPTTAPPPAGNVADPATIASPSDNLPDPFVLKVPGGFELYASQTGIYGQILPTAFSTTFGQWPATHAAMATVPSWGTDGFTWAPDVRFLGGKYVMYFDSMAQPSLYYNQSGTGFSHYAQCIGVATSTSPGGPFVGSSLPLICDFKAHGAIDPRTFLAPNGKLYLDWKSDDNAAAPATYAASHLYAQPLSADGLSLMGPAHVLISADERWQANIVEAPDMVEARGTYWLFYSGSWFNSGAYGVGYASCAGPTGPCTDRSTSGPLIGSNAQGNGPGEESLFESANGQWWMLYSPWFFGWEGRTNRPIAMAPIAFEHNPYVAALTATPTT
jgi:beta-xylosidase